MATSFWQMQGTFWRIYACQNIGHHATDPRLLRYCLRLPTNPSETLYRSRFQGAYLCATWHPLLGPGAQHDAALFNLHVLMLG